MLACDGTQGADKVPRKPQRILVWVDAVDHRFYRLLVSLTELRNGPGGQRLLVEVFLGTIAFSLLGLREIGDGHTPMTNSRHRPKQVPPRQCRCRDRDLASD
tara:strand:+ start:8303 stop:8608 length:306 start_codon:yes stop_codon:yes gene_type:complete